MSPLYGEVDYFFRRKIENATRESGDFEMWCLENLSGFALLHNDMRTNCCSGPISYDCLTGD
jgi:hypothetical protein